MLLDTTTRKIQVLTDATATTTESPVVADYVDLTSASGQAASNNLATNGVTAVDIVAAPASGVQRRVVEMSIENADTVNHTYTVRYNDNATTRIVVKMLLTPGQTLCYSSQNGWYIPTAQLSGGNKASFRAHKNSTDQSGITASTQTKVTFTNENYDTGSYYDAPNSKWVPPAGPVALGLQVRFTSTGIVDQALWIAYIYKNGSEYSKTLTQASGTGTFSLVVTAEDVANGTDYYEAYMYGEGAGTKTVEGGVANTNFFGTSL